MRDCQKQGTSNKTPAAAKNVKARRWETGGGGARGAAPGLDFGGCMACLGLETHHSDFPAGKQADLMPGRRKSPSFARIDRLKPAPPRARENSAAPQVTMTFSRAGKGEANGNGKEAV